MEEEKTQTRCSAMQGICVPSHKENHALDNKCAYKYQVAMGIFKDCMLLEG